MCAFKDTVLGFTHTDSIVPSDNPLRPSLIHLQRARKTKLQRWRNRLGVACSRRSWAGSAVPLHTELQELIHKDRSESWQNTPLPVNTCFSRLAVPGQAVFPTARLGGQQRAPFPALSAGCESEVRSLCLPSIYWAPFPGMLGPSSVITESAFANPLLPSDLSGVSK